MNDYLVIRQESQRVVNVYVVGTNDVLVRTNRTYLMQNQSENLVDFFSSKKQLKTMLKIIKGNLQFYEELILEFSKIT